MTALPCATSPHACRIYPCRWIKEQRFRKREMSWIAQKCEELKAREEGWKGVEDE